MHSLVYDESPCPTMQVDALRLRAAGWSLATGRARSFVWVSITCIAASNRSRRSEFGGIVSDHVVLRACRYSISALLDLIGTGRTIGAWICRAFTRDWDRLCRTGAV